MRMGVGMLLVMAVSAAACERGGKSAAPMPSMHVAGSGSGSAAAVPSACVDQCVQAGQMRATSIEQITAECQAHCAAATTTP